MELGLTNSENTLTNIVSTLISNNISESELIPIINTFKSIDSNITELSALSQEMVSVLSTFKDSNPPLTNIYKFR